MSRSAATQALSVLLIVLGIAICIETVIEGGGIGFALGPLLILAGALRIYLLRRPA
jgi:hypothetical protein